jgi:sugar phosphate isomerase/epimerase
MEVAREFERAGVVLAIENHDRFPAAMLRHLLEQVGSRAVGICFDTANSFGCGEGPREVLQTLRDWVVDVHVKDFRARRIVSKFGFVIEGAPAGEGLLDLAAVLGIFGEAGSRASVIVEQWPPFQGDIESTVRLEETWARTSIVNLRRYIAK